MVGELSTLLSRFILPLAVVISAAATTTTAGIAWKLYQAVHTHDRALFGEDRMDGHDGVVEAVNENTERSERNRRVLRAHDMVPAGQGDFYRGGPRADDDGDESRAT